jgi:hypothetical protein
MFIFRDKTVYGGNEDNVPFYTWSIVYDEMKIGTISLIIKSSDSGASVGAYLYRREVEYMSEEDIKQIMNDFKELANNKLLGIDEEYNHIYVIEAVYSDAVNIPIFY